jgi:hypothetical protein
MEGTAVLVEDQDVVGLRGHRISHGGLRLTEFDDRRAVSRVST